MKGYEFLFFAKNIAKKLVKGQTANIVQKFLIMLQNLKKTAEATIDSIVNKNEDKMKPQEHQRQSKQKIN